MYCRTVNTLAAAAGSSNVMETVAIYVVVPQDVQLCIYLDSFSYINFVTKMSSLCYQDILHNLII